MCSYLLNLKFHIDHTCQNDPFNSGKEFETFDSMKNYTKWKIMRPQCYSMSIYPDPLAI